MMIECAGYYNDNGEFNNCEHLEGAKCLFFSDTGNGDRKCPHRGEEDIDGEL